MRERSCEPSGSRLTCSDACKWLRRKALDGIPCAVCGKPTGWTKSSGITHAVVHKKCGRKPCGTIAAYRRGCRCDDCRAAVASSMRDYAARYKASTGTGLWGKYRNGEPGTKHGNAVPRATRLAIYERDQWTCGLCNEPVERDLPPNHRMAPSLDHIECQTWTLIPDHSPQNLRLAHRACNSARGNRVAV